MFIQRERKVSAVGMYVTYDASVIFSSFVVYFESRS